MRHEKTDRRKDTELRFRTVIDGDQWNDIFPGQLRRLALGGGLQIPKSARFPPPPRVPKGKREACRSRATRHWAIADRRRPSVPCSRLDQELRGYAMAGTVFSGKIGNDWRDSEPWWPPVPTPPAGAPNVELVVLDDVGFAR